MVRQPVNIKYITTIFLFAFSYIGTAQVLKADFLLRVLPDNSWTLNLKKDKSYKYTHWSGFSDNLHTLDSGQYNITGEVLTFVSYMPNSEDNFSKKQYYIKRIKLKRHQYIYEDYRSYKKRGFFNSKVIVLKLHQNDSVIIRSDKPSENIKQQYLANNNSLTSWIDKDILPYYNYKPTDLDSSYRTGLYSSKTLEVQAIHNSSDMFAIFYLAGGQVFYTTYYRDVKHQIYLLNLMYTKGHIKEKERQELQRKIELLIDQKTKK